MNRVWSRRRLIVFGALWLGVVSLGLAKLLIYQSEPGAQGSYAPRWPKQTKLKLDTSRPNLIMFAHPRCPCTMASLGELARIMAETNDKAAAYVLFLKPADAAEDWNKTSSIDKAYSMPGVRVLRDESGQEGHNFGAVTSGQVLLYDSNGTLRFHGGITALRGHEGANMGHSALVSLIRTGHAQTTETPVFGCSLKNLN